MSTNSRPGSSLSSRVFAPPTRPTQSLNSPVPPPPAGEAPRQSLTHCRRSLLPVGASQEAGGTGKPSSFPAQDSQLYLKRRD